MATHTEPGFQDDIDRGNTPHDHEATATHGASILWTAVTRRWPLLIVGVLVGLVLGFIYHVQRKPMYQSSAQVMVIKKKDNLNTSSDARMVMLDDIVNTQVTLIKSERILLAAGRLLNHDTIGYPLPPTERGLASLLLSDLSVARERETGAAAGAAPSNVLSLQYRAERPEASEHVLTKVIDAYRTELTAIYEGATNARIRALQEYILKLQGQLDGVSAEKGRLNDALLKLSAEDVQKLGFRVSALRQQMLPQEIERDNLARQIEMISQAGSDKVKRREVLAKLRQLGAQALFGGDFTKFSELSASPDVVIQLLKAQYAQMAERYGKDHAEMTALKIKIDIYEEMLGKKELLPNGMEVDDLWSLEQRLKFQQDTVAAYLKTLDTRIKEEEFKLVEATKLESKIKELSEKTLSLSSNLQAREKELNEVESTAGTGGYEAQVITAPAPGVKVSPVLILSMLLGLAVGILLGVGFAVLAETSDLGFRSPAEVRRRLGLPVIGHLPKLKPEANMVDTQYPALDPNLVVVHKPKSVEAEAYRGVRTQLYFSTQGRGHQMIQVTSPNPGDGKSTLAANLALTIAQSGKRVILVDCDLRKPRVHKVFNLPNPEIGMATVVSGATKLLDAVVHTEVPNLDMLPCGPRPANPAELLTSPQFAVTLKELRAAYDFVILDTPPMLAVSDPAVVAPRADGVILVLRMSKKARPSAERARELLGAVGANVIGVCVNGVASNSGGDYGYGYGYGYAYQYRYQYQYEYEYAENYADSPDDANKIDRVEEKSPAKR